jgi:hypothetical protein
METQRNDRGSTYRYPHIQLFLRTRTPIAAAASTTAGSILQNANTHQYKLQSHSSNKKYARRTEALK